jgi:hypothetical protein
VRVAFLEEARHQEGDEGTDENVLDQSQVDMGGCKCGDQLGPAAIGDDRSEAKCGGQRACVRAVRQRARNGEH